jgi:hypothetical protein
MSEKITYSVKAEVADGPTVTVKNSIDVDAYDKIEATIPTGGAATKVKVKVKPADDASFLLITASSYENISYKVDGGSSVDLDGPHILIGKGAVGLLGGTQEEFEFTNSASTDTDISILAGRDATS